MNTFSTSELKAGNFFSQKVYLDKNFMLLDPSVPISSELLKQLDEWKFTTVFSDGVISLKAHEVDSSSDQDKSSASGQVVDNEFLESLPDKIEDIKKLSETERLEFVRKVYDAYIVYINHIYTRFATHGTFDKSDIIQKVKNLCTCMKVFSKYFLRIANESYPFTRTYLVPHSMRSVMVSLAIGLQLRFSLQKLVDLGVAAMLHEIGMLRIPPKLYLNDKVLNTKEKKILSSHTVYTYQILKNADFPQSVQIGALDHHERENGSGYPQKKAGDKISINGKIIAIACVYDGIIADRRYKKSKTTSQAVVELLKNESNQFNKTIVKALLSCLSIYPIGTYVFLSNGKVAIVTDINPADMMSPIVEVVGSKGVDGNPEKIDTALGVKINRVLTNKEVEDIFKTLGKKQ